MSNDEPDVTGTSPEHEGSSAPAGSGDGPEATEADAATSEVTVPGSPAVVPPPYVPPSGGFPQSPSGSGDEPTTTMPVPGAPAGWQDQTIQQPTYPPTATHAPVAGGPPSAPPVYGAPPPPQGPPAAPGAFGHPPTSPPQFGEPPYGQPQYGQPQYGQPPYGQPPYGQQGSPVGGAPWGAGPQGTPAAPPTEKKKRTGLLIGLIAVGVLLVGAAVAVPVVLLGARSTTDLALAIDTCNIAADGSLSATGSVTNDGSDRRTVSVEVTFTDSSDGAEIDLDRSSVTVAGGSSERWTASGSAGDEVRQVTCDVTATP